MAKPTTKFVCQSCGAESSKWIGKCPLCNEWNTYVEEQNIQLDQKVIKKITEHSKDIVDLNNVELTQNKRIDTSFKEFDSAIGGGMIEDHVIFLTGEPGIGKSTLILQTAHHIANQADVLYVSAEESASQVANRLKRIIGTKGQSNVKFLANPSLGTIEESITKVNPRLVIIDSIQTIFDEASSSLPGSITQVKNTASRLVYMAKSKGFALVIIGHINKDGNIAGPKVLEHLVDTVVSIEGERDSDIRFLRVLKNRFGTTSEVGLLKMKESGLEDFVYKYNPEAEDAKIIGNVKTVTFEGSRPFIVDIQALVAKTNYPYPKRVAEGLSMSKLQLIVAILTANKIANLNDYDVYVKVADGFKIKEHPYTDLALAIAIISSLKKKQIGQQALYVGELNLNGSVKLTEKVNRIIKDSKRFFPQLSVYTDLIK